MKIKLKINYLKKKARSLEKPQALRKAPVRVVISGRRRLKK